MQADRISSLTAESFQQLSSTVKVPYTLDPVIQRYPSFEQLGPGFYTGTSYFFRSHQYTDMVRPRYIARYIATH